MNRIICTISPRKTYVENTNKQTNNYDMNREGSLNDFIMVFLYQAAEKELKNKHKGLHSLV